MTTFALAGAVPGHAFQRGRDGCTRGSVRPSGTSGDATAHPANTPRFTSTGPSIRPSGDPVLRVRRGPALVLHRRAHPVTAAQEEPMNRAGAAHRVRRQRCGDRCHTWSASTTVSSSRGTRRRSIRTQSSAASWRRGRRRRTPPRPTSKWSGTAGRRHLRSAGQGVAGRCSLQCRTFSGPKARMSVFRDPAVVAGFGSPAGRNVAAEASRPQRLALEGESLS